MNISAILVTLISSISFLIGYLIERLSNNKKKLTVYSIGLAFIVLLGLMIFDLLPEILESDIKWYLTILYVVIGIISLKLLDLFIPDHEHSKSHDHIEHISTISCIAVILHNIIECSVIYIISTTDLKAGLLMSLGVSCHNIPLSIQINSLSNSSKKQNIMTILLMISSLVGGILISIFNLNITEDSLMVLTCITLGMIIYISIFELLHEVIEHIKNKEMIYGLLTGILVVIIMLVL